MTRGEKLEQLIKGYRNGIWTRKDGTRRRISSMTDSEIKGIIFSLKNYAIASIHYDIFMLGKNNYRADLLNRYDFDFKQLVLDKLATHPVWKFIQNEINKRSIPVEI